MAQRGINVANLGVVDYPTALALQNAMVAARYADEIDDTLLLLEHPHVFTLGRGADERFLLAGRPPSIPVYRVSRGGQVTYHGPGQLIGYPILKLDGRDRDVSAYLRRLEEAMIRALGDFGIAAGRREKLTGVWVGEHKIASIGVGIRRWVTYHGLALNVCSDLRQFAGIVPCGIQGCELTSIAALGHPEVGVNEVAAAMRPRFAEVFGYQTIIDTDAAELWKLAHHAAPARIEHA